MLSGKKKFEILAAFATLLLFAVGVGCNGFFVDPVLTSVTVGPTATINQGGTVQESAVGTYNDGSSKSLTNVQWSSDTESVATVSTPRPGNGRVSWDRDDYRRLRHGKWDFHDHGCSQNVTGHQNHSHHANIKANGGTGTFTREGHDFGRQPVDVTATATWTASATDGGTDDDHLVNRGSIRRRLHRSTATPGARGSP